MSPLPRMLLATLAIGAAGTAMIVTGLRGRMRPGPAPALEMPVKGRPDPRWREISVWDAARLPLALRFDAPLGSEHAAMVRTVQSEGGPAGGGLEGIGGPDTSLGDPVFSVADGRVLYVGQPSPEWGNTVVIGHRTAEGKILQSVYAHLHAAGVEMGALVARGEVIGSVGTAGGRYPARLGFGFLQGSAADFTTAAMDRPDSLEALKSLRHAAADDLPPSPLNALRENP